MAELRFECTTTASGSSGVTSLNSLTGDLTVVGAGEVSVTSTGTTITIFGTPHTGGGASEGEPAIIGVDGITIISGTNITTVSGFRTEFVSASGSLQTQIDSVDSNVTLQDAYDNSPVSAKFIVLDENLTLSDTNVPVIISGSQDRRNSPGLISIGGQFLSGTKAGSHTLSDDIFFPRIVLSTGPGLPSTAIIDDILERKFPLSIEHHSGEGWPVAENDNTILFLATRSGEIGQTIVKNPGPGVTVGPGPVKVGDELGGLAFYGWFQQAKFQIPSTNYRLGGAIRSIVTTDFNQTIGSSPSAKLNFTTVSGGIPTVRVTIADWGGVGINIANPQERLHVVGNILSTGSVSAATGTYSTSLTVSGLPVLINTVDIDEIEPAIVGVDGITVISGSNTTTVSGFQTEFISASGSLQTQIDTIDSSVTLQDAYDNGLGAITTDAAKPVVISGAAGSVIRLDTENNVLLRMEDGPNATDVFEIDHAVGTITTFRKEVNSGVAIIDFDPNSFDGVSGASVRFFRKTLTPKSANIEMHKGTDTNNPTIRLDAAGFFPTFFDSGSNIGINTQTPSEALHVVGSGIYEGKLDVFDEITAASGTFSKSVTVSGLPVLISGVNSINGFQNDITVAGADGITIVNEEPVITVSGFQTAFVSASGSIQGQLDSHTGDSTIHFTEASIDHTNISNIGTNSHATIDSHIADSTIHFVEESLKAITGSDGNTVVTGTSTIDVAGFRTEFVSASGALQADIDAIDPTVSLQDAYDDGNTITLAGGSPIQFTSTDASKTHFDAATGFLGLGNTSPATRVHVTGSGIFTKGLAGGTATTSNLIIGATPGDWNPSHAGRIQLKDPVTWNDNINFSTITGPFKLDSMIRVGGTWTLPSNFVAFSIPGFIYVPIHKYTSSQLFSAAAAFDSGAEWHQGGAGVTDTLLFLMGFFGRPRWHIDHNGALSTTRKVCGFNSEPGAQRQAGKTGTGAIDHLWGYATYGRESDLASPATVGAGITVTDFNHFIALDPPNTFGGTVVNHIGFEASNLEVGTTLTAGFRSLMTTGSAKWGFYASGTANNAFLGNTSIGKITAPNVTLDVAGTISGTTGQFGGTVSSQTSSASTRLNIPQYVSDPSSPTNGDLWINTTTSGLRWRVNGVTSESPYNPV